MIPESHNKYFFKHYKKNIKKNIISMSLEPSPENGLDQLIVKLCTIYLSLCIQTTDPNPNEVTFYQKQNLIFLPAW